MANTFLTPDIIGREALMLLENNLVFSNLVHRDHQREWAGSKVGDTVTIRAPAQFEAQEFTTTTSAQNATETGVNLVLEKHFDVTVAVTSKDWTLELESFSRQVVNPAMVAIADAIDAYVASKYVEVHHSVGTAGDPPDSLADVLLVDREMNENKVPVRPRYGVLNPKAKADFLGIPQASEADKRGDMGSALRDASMGHFLGIDWFMNQNIKSHVAGTSSGALVAAQALVGATTITTDIGSGTLKKGDVITIDTVDGQYTVVSDVADVSAGTVTISPGLLTQAEDGDAITVVASHDANLAFHPGGIALAVVPLELPQGAAQASVLSDRGLGVRMVSDYSASTKTDTISFDVLVGSKVIHPDLCVRVLG